MIKLKVKFLFYMLALVLAVRVAQPVSAHGNAPRLEINLERINPGGTLEMRGVDFEYETEIALKLVGSQVDISLGTVSSDVDGIFVHNLVLPTDLPEGAYVVCATTYDHVIYSPTFTVWGAAISNAEENGIRDQSDVQLEPLPSRVPGMPTQTFDSAPMPVNPPAASKYRLLPLLGGLVVGAALLLAWIRQRRR